MDSHARMGSHRLSVLRYSDLKNILSIFFFSCLFLYFVFAPAVNLYYFGGDDYRYLFGSPSTACKLDDGFEFMLTLGRPLQAYLDCLSFKFANSIESMSVVRLICVLIMGIGMGLLTLHLIKLNLSIPIAFSAAGIFFLLPQAYPDILLYGAIALPFSIALTLIAYFCLEKSYTKFNKLITSLPIWGGVILLICSMLAYPATAFFFVILVLLKLLLSPVKDWEITRRQVLTELFAFITAGIAYFIWGYYTMHYHPLTPVPASYQLDHPNLNLFEIIKRIVFLSNVFEGQWTLSTGIETHLQGLLTLIFISAAMIILFYKNFDYLKTSAGIKKTLEISLYVFIVLLLSVAFILVMPSLDLLENRVLLGRAAACFALVFWGLISCSLIFPSSLRQLFVFLALSVFLVIQGYQANIISFVNALSQAHYLNLDKMAVSQYFSKNKSLQRIHFIIPKNNYPYDRFFMAYASLLPFIEKNKLEIKWCSQARGSVLAEKDNQQATINCVQDLKKGAIAITYSYDGDEYKKTKSMLIIQNHYLKIDPRTLNPKYINGQNELS